MISGEVIYEDIPDSKYYGSFNIHMELEGLYYQSYPNDHESYQFSFGFVKNYEPEPYIYGDDGESYALNSLFEKATLLKKKVDKKIDSFGSENGGYEFNS